MTRRSLLLRSYFAVVAASCGWAGWMSHQRKLEDAAATPPAAGMTAAAVLPDGAYFPENPGGEEPIEAYELRYLLSRERDARTNPVLAELLERRQGYLAEAPAAKDLAKAMRDWASAEQEPVLRSARSKAVEKTEDLAALVAQVRGWASPAEEFELVSTGLRILKPGFSGELREHEISQDQDIQVGRQPSTEAAAALEHRLRERKDAIVAAAAGPADLFGPDRFETMIRWETQRLVYTQSIQSMLSAETKDHQRRLAEQREKRSQVVR